jgi:hypothetical protein
VVYPFFHGKETVICLTLVVRSCDNCVSLEKVYELVEIFDVGSPHEGMITCSRILSDVGCSQDAQRYRYRITLSHEPCAVYRSRFMAFNAFRTQMLSVQEGMIISSKVLLRQCNGTRSHVRRQVVRFCSIYFLVHSVCTFH